MNYTINTLSNCGKCEYVNETVHFVANTASADARFFLEVNFEDWEDDCYVLVPACAYDGNKYGSVERPYPPMYHKGEVGENEEPLILRGIPSLGKDGKGKLECTVADASSPIIGIFNHEKKEAFSRFENASFYYILR